MAQTYGKNPLIWGNLNVPTLQRGDGVTILQYRPRKQRNSKEGRKFRWAVAGITREPTVNHKDYTWIQNFPMSRHAAHETANILNKLNGLPLVD